VPCLLKNVGGAGDAGGDALCATLYAGGYGGCVLLPEVPGLIRCLLLRMLEVMEGVFCVLEVMSCVQLRMLEVVEVVEVVDGVLCLLEGVGGAAGVGGDSLCASLLGGGVGGTGGDALYVTLLAGGCLRCWRCRR